MHTITVIHLNLNPPFKIL